MIFGVCTYFRNMPGSLQSRSAFKGIHAIFIFEGKDEPGTLHELQVIEFLIEASGSKTRLYS